MPWVGGRVGGRAVVARPSGDQFLCATSWSSCVRTQSVTTRAFSSRPGRRDESPRTADAGRDPDGRWPGGLSGGQGAERKFGG